MGRTNLVSRQLDELGRVVIPADHLKMLSLEPNDNIHIEILKDFDQSNFGLLLTKARPVCTFCDSPDSLSIHLDKPVCTDCLNKLKQGEPVKKQWFWKRWRKKQ